jgi:hypothetical protein
MPDPKKARRTFAAQTPSVIEHIQLLEQQARSAETTDLSNPADSTQPGIATGSTEPALVKKLIKFIKTI